MSPYSQNWILFTLFYLFCLLCSHRVICLDNGLARTPPMGWLSWARYPCITNCSLYPNSCVSENLYKAMADRLVSDGYFEAGYEYINIDDCWSEKQRDPITSSLVADRVRFPSGIKNLADYVHKRGLKLGIYGDMGNATCAGYPGFLIGGGSATDYIERDVETFANWTIDSLKVDGCNADPGSFDAYYPRLGSALNMTGRPILYSCSWPAYQVFRNQSPNYAKISKTCNLWRNYDDIEDSWHSITSILDFYANNQDIFSRYQGPGAWFDPDMVIIGNFGLSYGQSRAQMALWAILSAPLMMSNDLRSIPPEIKKILLNREVIAVNQDKLGIMGRRVIKEGNFEVWRKPVLPIINDSYSFAVVYFNRGTLGSPTFHSCKLADILKNETIAHHYKVRDLFQEDILQMKLSVESDLTLLVNPSGSIRMVKLTPVN